MRPDQLEFWLRITFRTKDRYRELPSCQWLDLDELRAVKMIAETPIATEIAHKNI
jgi:hypothetical protein